MSRKTLLSECAPRWYSRDGGVHRHGVSFDCPEADGGCGGRHTIPTSTEPDGTTSPTTWGVSGNLPNITLNPSIRCGGACRMHIQIRDGRVEFCPNSKSGPDWNRSGE